MNNILSGLKHVVMAVLSIGFSLGALASIKDVKYIDASRAEQICAKAVIVTSAVQRAIWTAGWYVVTNDVTIAGGADVSGDVHLILADGAMLTCIASEHDAGIGVTDGNSLTIYGQTDNTGKLIADASEVNNSAGIGGYTTGAPNRDNGPITINGGDVTAIGGDSGAGIGGGCYGAGSDITINGGVVTVTGGYRASGIGGGDGGVGQYILINGGMVTANGGDSGGAGIGGGWNCGRHITINDGTVMATGGSGGGAGIGGGQLNPGEYITINGGEVTAVGANGGAGIGGGSEGEGRDIAISNGIVVATGSCNAAGIGGGFNRAGKAIFIGGGEVYAHGGNYAAGIGGGVDCAGTNIVISGGMVKACGGAGGAGVGGGMRGVASDITIGNAKVMVNSGMLLDYWGNWISGECIGNGCDASENSNAILVDPSAQLFFNLTGAWDHEHKEWIEAPALMPTNFADFVVMTPATQTISRVLIGGGVNWTAATDFALTNAATCATNVLTVGGPWAVFAGNMLSLRNEAGNLVLKEKEVITGYTDDCIAFSSRSPFTLAIANGEEGWNGSLWVSIDKSGWVEWDASAVSAGITDASATYNLYVRGNAKNTRIVHFIRCYQTRWVLTGDAVSCSGNIETLRGATGDQPSPTQMASDCYNSMFSGCTSLISAPELPATSLADSCYEHMFAGCTSLTMMPQLPATTLVNECYSEMFRDCSVLEVNSEAPGKKWKIPATSTDAQYWGYYTFENTSGSEHSHAYLNMMYYVASAPSVVAPQELEHESYQVFTNDTVMVSDDEPVAVRWGATVKVVFTADDGYEFAGGVTTEAVTVTADADIVNVPAPTANKIIMVTLSLPTLNNVTVTATTNDGVVVNGELVVSNVMVKVEYVAAPGYLFADDASNKVEYIVADSDPTVAPTYVAHYVTTPEVAITAISNACENLIIAIENAPGITESESVAFINEVNNIIDRTRLAIERASRTLEIDAIMAAARVEIAALAREIVDAMDGKIRFATKQISVIEGTNVEVLVYGGATDRSTGAKLTLVKGTAKTGKVYIGTYGEKSCKSKFPMCLSWKKGDLEPKKIYIETKVSKKEDVNKFFTLQLGSEVKADMGTNEVLTVTVKDSVKPKVSDVGYIRTLAYPENGGKTFGYGDFEGRVERKITAKANKWAGFAGWYHSMPCDEETIDITNGLITTDAKYTVAYAEIPYSLDDGHRTATYYAYFTNVTSVIAVDDPDFTDETKVEGVTVDTNGVATCMVGVPVSFPLNFVVDVGDTTGKVSVKNLPKGLKYQKPAKGATLGHIIGTPKKAGTFEVEVKGKNNPGQHYLYFTMDVAPVP